MRKVASREDRTQSGSYRAAGVRHRAQDSGTRTPPSAASLRCDACRSDEHLVLRSIESLPAHAGDPLVHVIYACTACGTSHAHAVPFRDVAGLLNEVGAVPGILQFGEFYLHCGMPMTVAGTATRSIQVPPSTGGSSKTGLPDVVLTAKILSCTCGFRIELPA